MKPRQILLTVALVVTLLAVFWPQPDVLDVVTAAPRTKPPHPPLAKQQDIDIRLGAMRVNLFPSQTWSPPAAPPPPLVVAWVPSPVTVPVAPALPFQFVGRWQDKEGEFVFLAQGNQLIKAKVGDTLSGWRLDQVSEDALSFTWIELNLPQILRISP